MLALRDDPDLVQLCVVLARAERLAMRCAGRQARLCTDPMLKRRFAAQQRHERAHAALFEGLLASAPRAAPPPSRALVLIDAYEGRLDNSKLAESVLGLQVVFEGAAAALFRAVDLGWRDAAFEPLRRLLAAQEQAHHELGRRALGVLAPVPGRVESGYRRLSKDLVDACEPMLRRFARCAP